MWIDDISWGRLKNQMDTQGVPCDQYLNCPHLVPWVFVSSRQAWRNERLSKVSLQDQFWLVQKKKERKWLKVKHQGVHWSIIWKLGMRNSTRPKVCFLFWTSKQNFEGSLISIWLLDKRNNDPGYEGSTANNYAHLCNNAYLGHLSPDFVRTMEQDRTPGD